MIRDGTIVDGSGGAPHPGDVAVRDGVIVAVGSIDGVGKREIDATGLLVTPGFVDLHTHYDGQAIWSDRLNPSSSHGVTPAVIGNCGVGFAPCRPADHDVLVDVMAGVEDVPGGPFHVAVPFAPLSQIFPGTPLRQISSTSFMDQTNPRSDSLLVRPE